MVKYRKEEKHAEPLRLAELRQPDLPGRHEAPAVQRFVFHDLPLQDSGFRIQIIQLSAHHLTSPPRLCSSLTFFLPGSLDDKG